MKLQMSFKTISETIIPFILQILVDIFGYLRDIHMGDFFEF